MDIHEYSSAFAQRALCWDCANATGGCAWSEKHEPIQGQIVRHENEGVTVIECPEFDRNSWGGGLYRDGDNYRRIMANRQKKHGHQRGRPKSVTEETMYKLLTGEQR